MPQKAKFFPFHDGVFQLVKKFDTGFCFFSGLLRSKGGHANYISFPPSHFILFMLKCSLFKKTTTFGNSGHSQTDHTVENRKRAPSLNYWIFFKTLRCFDLLSIFCSLQKRERLHNIFQDRGLQSRGRSSCLFRPLSIFFDMKRNRDD